MVDLSRAVERRKFADRRAALMFTVHLGRSRMPADAWMPSIHIGTEPEAAIVLPPIRAILDPAGRFDA